MSFFLSKSLEGKISENDLLDSEPETIYEDAKEDIDSLSIKINNVFFKIKCLKKNRFVIDLNYEDYKQYLKQINKNKSVDFYIFDNLLFSKKADDLFINSYERLSSSLIKLDIIIN